MEKLTQYMPTNKMSELIDDNSVLLMVMSRFGISLGFGKKTVGEICHEQGVDCNTFLAVANFVSRKEYNTDNISLTHFINYLKRAHNYFLDFCLPMIRRKLIEAIYSSGADDLALLILKFYDEYVQEVRRHMEYENKTVFAYVERLLEGELNEKFTISVYEAQHNHIDPKLKELKDIITRYYPEKENDLLNTVLFDIINCEQDLKSHCKVEDSLFVPKVMELENDLRTGSAKINTTTPTIMTEDEKLEILSQREKEIICCVAKGMSNKEIADNLNLSIHTVTTHRRNISSKLEIRTPAGLTIFAIANKMVKIQDIKLQ